MFVNLLNAYFRGTFTWNFIVAYLLVAMGDEEQSEGDAEADEEDRLGMWAADDDTAEDDESKVQRKLHLFQNGSIQMSIQRIWDIVPKDEQGMLPMESYIGLNIGLQKCLTQEFNLARAVDSAIGDWGEDVRDGQQSMSAEEFAMFLFELCSLWCGPTISLRVYLLFLNAIFVVITDARGAHTVGLKALEAVERLPDAFFELLSVQGWAKLEEDGMDEESAMKVWMLRNLSSENEQSSLLQVQRQIFQVTHDVRSVLLFRRKDDKKKNDHDVLDLVKASHKNLRKISQVEPEVLLTSSQGAQASSKAIKSAELNPLPWCPGSKHPGKSLYGKSPQAAIVSAPSSIRRGASAPTKHRSRQGLAHILDRPPLGVSRLNQSGGTLALPPAAHVGREDIGEVPVGRAFDVVEARRPGLMLAGQSTVAVGPGIDRPPPAGWSMRKSPESYTASQECDESVEQTLPRARTPASALSRSSPASPAFGKKVVATVDRELPPLPLRQGVTEELIQANDQATQLLAHIASRLTSGEGPLASEAEATFLEGSTLSPAYALPKKAADLYRHQIAPAMKVHPGSIVFAANKWQKEHPLVGEPFERAMQKLPAHARPPSEGPPFGPLAHANEPVWFEMAHRLQVILKRQGRRAERRRKRRMKAKLLRGKGPKAQTRNEGMELRGYLDSKAAEHARGFRGAAPGEPSGEFLGKVHERYLLNRDRLEDKPFRYRGIGGAVVDAYGIGQYPSRPATVVRPVYIPPPEVSM